MKVVLVSDTHELHEDLTIPPADLLIHAGDLGMFARTETPIRRFNKWLGSLPVRRCVVVPGNHEYVLESNPAIRSLLSNADVLLNEAIVIESYTIWGAAVTMQPGGAFAVPRAPDRARIYAKVPEHTDILVSHVPPLGILDGRQPGVPSSGGDFELRKALNRVRPRLHVFGHVHDAYGTVATEHTLFANASMLDRLGGVDTRRPIAIELKTPRRALGA